MAEQVEEQEIESDQRLAIEADIGETVNLAQQQHDFPFLHELKIENLGDEPLDDLVLEISAEPGFLTGRKWRFDYFPPHEETWIADLDVRLSYAYLAGLSEAVRATVSIVAFANDQKIGSWTRAVRVLAPEEWGGLEHLPDLTAAFCLPNDPAVEKVLKLAARALKAAGKDGDLDGYQSKDRNRVWRQVSAIYSGICSLNLNYTAPPASFEQQGQKIRTPSRILDSGMGTCLDLALFMAACLEQCGLRPLLILTEGHAFVGCWLVETDFSSTVVDDCQSVRKRQQLGEMVLMEATAVTQQPAPSFMVAAEQGNRHLEKDDLFWCALDISRARMNEIRPLVSQGGPPSTEPQETVATDEGIPTVEDAPELPPIEFRPEDTSEKPDTPESRVEQWKRKLLDLTLRNKLLNFKATQKTVVPIFCPNPARLEDMLADDTKFEFVALPDIMEGQDPRSKQLHQARHSKDAKKQFALKALDRRELLVDLTPRDMESRLVGLYRLARREMEEGGANTLFLAMGFLSWTQADASSRDIKAPLLLLPVHLERVSVQTGYKLFLHEDDPCLNPTLLEMLRRDFHIDLSSLNDNLPRDQSGLDVGKIWQTMRRYVRDLRGWEVTEEVYLGTFSFTKYLMWKDLQDRLDQLKQNPVVHHLIENPREPYQGSGEFPDPKSLDDEYRPEDIYCPLPADSSQLAAILAAAQGNDFVVVGPPGTGKSQTITNMIVQCLVEGKTVLFVSQKMAALDVVYRRLRQVGMGDHCLEIHSSKARKTDVLKQLETAWNSREAYDEQEWQENARKLCELRKKLNQYPRRLHKKYPNGLTPYEALGLVIAHPDTPELRFSWPSGVEHSKEDLEKLRELVSSLVVNAEDVGELSLHPLRCIRKKAWSPLWQQDLQEKAEGLRASIEYLQESLQAFLDSLGLNLSLENRKQIKTLCDLAELLPRAAGKSYAFAFSAESQPTIQQLEQLAACGRNIEQLESELSQEYRREATALDLEELDGKWQEAKDAWVFKSYFLRRAVAHGLGSCTVSRKRPQHDDIPCDLSTLKRIKDNEEIIGDLAEVGGLLGRDWQELETQWSEVESAVGFAKEITSILVRLSGGDLDKLVSLRNQLKHLVVEGDELLAEGGLVRRKAERALAAYGTFRNKLAETCAAADSEDALADPGSPQWLSDLHNTMGGWLANLNKLRAWCGWQEVCSHAIQLGLNPLVIALKNGDIEPDQAESAFRVNYCRWWLDLVIEQDEVLRSFRGSEHERYISDFKKLDEDMLACASKLAKARISTAIPSQQEYESRARTEWGVLRREITKKRRHMPLRKLIESLPNVLTKLTPCLLMSPLSVAQYLSPATALFDLVIFDEASQIPVWDAVGALARGKQAIVVGDPKQLPPTSFFMRSDDEEGLQEWEVEDLESILDECQGSGLHNHYLRWHYRSRHESLIVFSNQKYYQGGLITYPSTSTKDEAVRYIHVPEGQYEKGRARVNREEARAVVRGALAWLRNPEFVREGWSLGVVTFNQQQQVLIEDMLDEERRKDPELEPHFSHGRPEPVFVKNLENVQGDERDVILFSLTYGPDVSGRVSMNFGPLNKDGGERRLNVAITRARRALHVYGTLKADHIDLSRTKAVGVRHFKHFLDFAERGPRALAEITDAGHGDYESPFEQEVAEELQKRGWIVHPQVGVSGFRLDLGVVHPETPGRYLAGVECDGATYHSSATARDRDRLREAVLRDLGWEIVRVWSTDWWVDRKGEAEKLDQELKDILALDKRKQERDGRAPKVAACSPTGEATAAGHSEPAQTDPVIEPPSDREPEIEVSAGKSAKAEPPSPDAQQEIYRFASVEGMLPADAGKEFWAEEFYNRSHTLKLKAMIKEVVETEGPVALETVIEVVAYAHGFKRIGKKIRQRISRLAKREHNYIIEKRRTFLWPFGRDPETWSGFRINPHGQKPLRPAERVCKRELANLAAYVQEVDCPVDERGLLKGMADRLGYAKLTKSLENTLRKALPDLK